MTKIIFPAIHHTLQSNLRLALANSEFEVHFPSDGMQYVRDLTPDMPQMSVEQILDEDDLIICVSAMQVFSDVMDKVWFKKDWRKNKLVFYSGNDATAFSYIKNAGGIFKNFFYTDEMSHHIVKDNPSINSIRYYPYVDYDLFEYKGPSDGTTFGSYMNGYQANFPNDHAMINRLVNWATEEQNAGLDYVECGGQPKKETAEIMQKSIGTFHFKSHDGYGYAIIESLACGRPVIMPRKQTVNRTYLNWCIENETCLLVDSDASFLSAVSELSKNEETRHKIQENCAKAIREKINNEEQTENFLKFLRSLW